jgi:uncharacterized protein (DUF1684 family)
LRVIRFLFISVIFLSACASIKIDPEYKKEILEWQEQMNRDFANPLTSPLDKKDLETFESLDFFPVNPKYRVKAKIVRNPDPEPFEFPTNTTRTPVYIKYADAYFHLDGKEHHLEIYQNVRLSQTEKYKDYLFLPFGDETNGKTTYHGGRYLDLHIPGGDTLIIDFNKAYNPYCAYSARYSCPLIPKQNILKIKIKAGVKKFRH